MCPKMGEPTFALGDSFLALRAVEGCSTLFAVTLFLSEDVLVSHEVRRQMARVFRVLFANYRKIENKVPIRGVGILPIKKGAIT